MAEIAQGGGDKGGKKRSKKASTRIDMTPMVDLGFLLITFFILTTTLQKPVTMQLNMPDKTETEQKSEVKLSETITVIPDDKGVYYYQGLPNEAGTKVAKADYSKSGIRQVLFDYRNRIGKDPSTGKYKIVIVIKPSKTAKYKNMVDFIDECVITECKQYAILEIDPDTEALIKKSGL